MGPLGPGSVEAQTWGGPCSRADAVPLQPSVCRAHGLPHSGGAPGREKGLGALDPGSPCQRPLTASLSFGLKAARGAGRKEAGAEARPLGEEVHEGREGTRS